MKLKLYKKVSTEFKSDNYYYRKISKAITIYEEQLKKNNLISSKIICNLDLPTFFSSTIE